MQYVVETKRGGRFVVDSSYDSLTPAKRRCGQLVGRSAGMAYADLPRVIERRVVSHVSVNGRRLVIEKVVA